MWTVKIQMMMMTFLKVLCTCIHKALSYDYQLSVDVDHRNTREEMQVLLVAINAAGPSSSKGDESYK